jgi:hypothetical protein
LEDGELDKQSDRASQVFADDQVLLSADLALRSIDVRIGGSKQAYALKKIQQVSARFFTQMISFIPRKGSHDFYGGMYCLHMAPFAE